MAEQQGKVLLGYWAIRGLAQPIRFLLEYTGTPYEERRYQQGDAPDYSIKEWAAEKYNLGLDFPNLPYLIDGDIKITQSNAILRYIARRANPALLGKDKKEQALVDMLIDTVFDFRNDCVRLFYSSNFHEEKGRFLKKRPTVLGNFEQFLSGKKFLAGEEPTVPDFHLCELLDQNLKFDHECLRDFPQLQEYLSRFQAIPAIAEHIKSEGYLNLPANNKIAAWGSSA